MPAAHTITIRGKEIEVERCWKNISDIRYYSENPRIYSMVYTGDSRPTQAEIEDRLLRMDHVRQLIQSIKANGGITDPIIVHGGTSEVLEGNSRLAAYRALARKDGTKWAKIKCDVLPPEVEESVVFALLGEYHIIGRKDWAPFEQAGYLWRRNKVHSIDSSQMAAELGLTPKRVNYLIRVYDFMVKKDDKDISHWSYYDEYLKSNPIKKARAEHPDLDELIVKDIKRGKLAKAADIRDKLTVIARDKKKALPNFVNGQKSFEEAYEIAVAKGADNRLLRRVSDFQKFITDPEINDEIASMNKTQKDKCKYYITKIHTRCNQLLKRLP
ncbi:MAG: hypothetical protein C4575_07335 [Desulforudis sp.]|jgi:hypothetical protein|nr:MAG: hypothetical protein C4575_07335 [Desulforudis sp.]